jgi:hypothetical protein
MSDPTSERSADFVLLTRLADEFAERYQRGERPSLTEYVERYPHLAADTFEVLPTSRSPSTKSRDERLRPRRYSEKRRLLDWWSAW